MFIYIWVYIKLIARLKDIAGSPFPRDNRAKLRNKHHTTYDALNLYDGCMPSPISD